MKQVFRTTFLNYMAASRTNFFGASSLSSSS